MTKITTTDLIHDGVVLRGHGNGFIQAEIDDGVRLHFWGHPSMPRQKVYTPIHDHAWGFKSTILRGALRNVRLCEYRGTRKHNQNYAVWSPEKGKSCKESALADTGERMALTIDADDLLTEGQSYEMRAGAFHESTAPLGPTITIMRKIRVERAECYLPRILVPVGVQPDDSFNLKPTFTQDDLWDIVDEMLTECGGVRVAAH